MAWLKSQFKQGLFGQGWTNFFICVILAAGVYITSEIYYPLNHGPNRIFLRTPLDDLLPIVPPFVIPYVSLEPFIYASLILFNLFRSRVFKSAAFSMITAMGISYAIYFFLQSYVDRPALSGNDLLTQMIRQVYASDNPYNDFPSLHTSLSTILALHWLRVDRRIGLPVAVWVLLIVLSTVLVKQHYVPDVAGGLVLAFTVAPFFLRRFAPQAVQPAISSALEPRVGPSQP